MGVKVLTIQEDILGANEDKAKRNQNLLEIRIYIVGSIKS